MWNFVFQSVDSNLNVFYLMTLHVSNWLRDHALCLNYKYKYFEYSHNFVGLLQNSIYIYITIKISLTFAWEPVLSIPKC